MVQDLDRILERLQGRGLFIAVYECRFFATEVKGSGWIYFGEGVTHDRERVQGLMDMRRPEIVRAPMQICRQ